MSETTQPFRGAQRALAAIVFTDVVGFSTRMEVDEAATLDAVERDFQVMRRLCAAHEGAVVKGTGDGLMCRFGSAVQAVSCALAIQSALREAGRALPKESVLEHRIGIHLGDVVVQEGDVLGEGVNIAARLQAEASPGGICVSQTVYDVVRNKLELQARFLGERELKNLAQTVPVYEVSPAGERPVVRPLRKKDANWKLVASALGGALAVALLVVAGLMYWRARIVSQREARLSESGEATGGVAAAGARPAAGETARPLVVAAGVLDQLLTGWVRDELVFREGAWLEFGGEPDRGARCARLDAPLEVRDGDAVATFDWTEVPPLVLGRIVMRLYDDAEASGHLPPPRVSLAAAQFAARHSLPEMERRMRADVANRAAEGVDRLQNRRPRPGGGAAPSMRPRDADGGPLRPRPPGGQAEP